MLNSIFNIYTTLLSIYKLVVTVFTLSPPNPHAYAKKPIAAKLRINLPLIIYCILAFIPVVIYICCGYVNIFDLLPNFVSMENITPDRISNTINIPYYVADHKELEDINNMDVLINISNTTTNVNIFEIKDSPLDQFIIREIISLTIILLGNIRIALTNIGLYLLIAG